MVQVIFRNAVEDTTISVNVKGLYHVPLTKAEREWVYQILGCFVTKKFLENCIIQQAKLIKEETYYEKRKREKKITKKEIVRSLRWLSNMFPWTDQVESEEDWMSNAIHIYTKVGAERIEALEKELEKNRTTMVDGVTTCCGYDAGCEKIRYCPMCGKKIR